MVDGAERIISSGELEQMTMEELIGIYNSTMPKVNARSFRSVAEAVRMILERLVEIDRRKPSRKPKPRRGRPWKLLDLPLRNPRRKSKSGQVRGSTKRDLLLRMLARGTTVKQVEAALACSRKLARESLRQINLDFGYGIKEHEDGLLQFTKE